MPLSDNEQRLLEQMERALYAEDPKFASAMRGANRRPGAARRLAIGGTGIVLGLVVLVLGVAQGNVWPGVWIGVLGFVCMLASTAYAVSEGSFVKCPKRSVKIATVTIGWMIAQAIPTAVCW